MAVASAPSRSPLPDLASLDVDALEDLYQFLEVTAEGLGARSSSAWSPLARGIEASLRTVYAALAEHHRRDRGAARDLAQAIAVVSAESELERRAAWGDR